MIRVIKGTFMYWEPSSKSWRRGTIVRMNRKSNNNTKGWIKQWIKEQSYYQNPRGLKITELRNPHDTPWTEEKILIKKGLQE